jgi:hypothetical protein
MSPYIARSACRGSRVPGLGFELAGCQPPHHLLVIKGGDGSFSSAAEWFAFSSDAIAQAALAVTAWCTRLDGPLFCCCPISSTLRCAGCMEVNFSQIASLILTAWCDFDFSSHHARDTMLRQHGLRRSLLLSSRSAEQVLAGSHTGV